MSNVKHTPGPWEWDGNVWGYDSENEAPWLVQAPWTGKSSKNVLTGTIKCESEADARLIAAAPELLEALHELYVALEIDGCAQPFQMQKARAAIAKATQAERENTANQPEEI
jgi:hypothetical protein